MYPRLTPHTTVLRRGPGEIQVGLDPWEAVVLTGLSGTEIDRIEGLDGSVALTDLANEPGADRLDDLVQDLRRRGLVDDARSGGSGRATVAIDGDGAVSTALAALLDTAGVGVRHGSPVVDEIDLAGRSGRAPLVGGLPDLVVTVAVGAVSPLRARAGGEIPCLPIVLRNRAAEVGPLVTPDGPCLTCLDLTRVDHDPAWVRVLAQLGRHREPRLPTPLTTLAASLAATRVLGVLRGTDTLHHRSVEMSLDPARVAHRRWSRHPRCARHPGASDPALPVARLSMRGTPDAATPTMDA